MDLLDPGQDLDCLTHVISEPVWDASCGGRESGKKWSAVAGLPTNVRVLSFLYISERLLKVKHFKQTNLIYDNLRYYDFSLQFKARPLKEEYFSVYNGAIQAIHKKFFSNNNDSANSTNLLKKDASILLAPDSDLTFASPFGKRPPRTPLAGPESKKMRFFSPSATATNMSPKRPIRRRLAFKEDEDSFSSSQGSQSNNNNDSSLSDKFALVTTTVEDIKEAHLRGICRRMVIYGSDLTHSAPRPLMVAADTRPMFARCDGGKNELEHFFAKAVEELFAPQVEGIKREETDEEDDCKGEDPGYRWMWVASFLRENLSRDWQMSKELFWKLAIHGLLRQPDQSARQAVHSLLISVIDYDPPVSELKDSGYLEALKEVLDTLEHEPSDIFDFLMYLIGCIEGKEKSDADDCGEALLLDVLCKILKTNFDSCYDR